MRTPAVLALSITLASSVIACGSSSRRAGADTREDVDLKAEASKVAAEMGVTLPEAATVEFAEHIDGRDNAGRLVVTMPDADWANWRRQLVPSRPEQPPFTAAENYELGSDDGAWAPGKARGLTTVQVPWRNATYLNIGQSPAGNGRVRVFLFWFQT